jgi:hypothetical protein
MGTHVLRNNLREIVEFVARKATKPQIYGNLTRIKVEEEVIEAPMVPVAHHHIQVREPV